MSPLRQVVHVLEQFWPSHDTWCGICGDEIRASAFWECTDLLAHVHTDTGKLVLELRAVLQVLRNASLLGLCALDERCLLCPTLQLTMSPLRQVIHMLEQLWPSHDTWCGIWGDEIRASAFWECSDLLAHVNADTGKLVLELRTMLEVLRKASLLGLRTLDERCLLSPTLQLTMAPLRQVVHVLE